ncbi:MAG: S-layer homology domain-containing protein, partial [Cohnella sp.]|nr:S-layer homology domain-containing protein [Cohnella sp.]
AKLLKENGIDLEIYTANAIIRLPNASMDGIEEAFYFRLVPVKDEPERNEIEERAIVEKVVRDVAGNNKIEVVARPMTIETNLSSRQVTLILPLKDVVLPEREAEREAFLAQLGIFIEHSDGQKEVVKGKPVTYNDGLLGLEFTVSKFSTFTIINFNNHETKSPEGEATVTGSHEAYINGFPDGEFKPDEHVTRAQIAVMIARNFGYDANAPINGVPFEDVAAEHYAASAIAFVKARGIMNGYSDGRFQADETITRAEMAAVISNDLKLSAAENGKSRFEDTAGHWAQAIIEASLAAGIVEGYPDGSFKPNNQLTRAEAVVIINRMFHRGPLYGTS